MRHSTYSAFFDFYLGEHDRPQTRALHYLGSACGIMALILTVVTCNPLWIVAGLLCGYGCAWAGHFFIEHNRPATFKYPLWSFIADYHMFALWLTGQLARRRARAANSQT
ncbi:MAG: Mpo1-like protein [Asticcacaulis sp.]